MPQNQVPEVVVYRDTCPFTGETRQVLKAGGWFDPDYFRLKVNHTTRPWDNSGYRGDEADIQLALSDWPTDGRRPQSDTLYLRGDVEVKVNVVERKRFSPNGIDMAVLSYLYLLGFTTPVRQKDVPYYLGMRIVKIDHAEQGGRFKIPTDPREPILVSLKEALRIAKERLPFIRRGEITLPRGVIDQIFREVGEVDHEMTAWGEGLESRYAENKLLFTLWADSPLWPLFKQYI